MTRSYIILFATCVALLALVLADTEQSGVQVASSFGEFFVFPAWSPQTQNNFVNVTDTTNHWQLSFTTDKQILINLIVTQAGNAFTQTEIDGYLVELSTGHSYEFTALSANIPFTVLRSVPDVKWVNIQNVFASVTTGNLLFNMTIKYADFWTNAQAQMYNDKSEVDLVSTNCHREEFRMGVSGFLQSKPFWIFVQLANGSQLTFPVPAGNNCSYSRGMDMVRTVC